MPIPLIQSGTQTATPGTEHTLATITVPTGGACYVLKVDVANMQGVEAVELTAQSKVLAAGTRRVELAETYDALSPIKVACLDAVVSQVAGEVAFTLRQIGGSSRTFDWAILRADGP